MICNIPFVYRIPELNRLRELALAVTLASKYYEVRVWSNLPLENYFDLPAKRQGLLEQDVEKALPWSMAKLAVYQWAGRLTEEKDPVLFVDSDVFLSKPLPGRLFKAPLFAQSSEGLECYPGLTKMPEDWRKACVPDLEKFRGYNMGVFGGEGELVRQYAFLMIVARKNLAENIRNPAANLIEQAPLHHFANCRKLKVETLFENPEDAAELGYTHLMADKDKWEIKEKVARRLQEEAPDLARQLSISPLRPISTRVTMGDVRAFWSDKRWLPKPEAPVLDYRITTLTNTPSGLGDTVVLTGVLPQAAPPRNASIWAQSRHFHELIPFVPLYTNIRHLRWTSLSSASELYDLGAGHNIQRACRLLGLPIPRIPKGHLVVPGAKKPNKVTLHLNPGGHARWQRDHVHPRARIIDERTLDALCRFILDRTDLEFVQIGESAFPGLPERVRDFTGRSLHDTLMMQQKASFHLGILSGPMHTAAALDCKCIILTVMPKPSELMLPTMVDTGIVEGEWIPPQAVVLHQEIDSPHWPLVTPRNLNRAIDGDVWPYWDNSNIEWQP